jgi:hypothetical protein
MNTPGHKGRSTRLYPSGRAAAGKEWCKPTRLLVWLVVALVFSCLTAPLQAQLTEQQTRELFTEANQLFRQANEAANVSPVESQDLYRRAVLRFERIASEGGVRNGMLFYNIGNAHFRMNDIGCAILNYRHAEQYIPGDRNLALNLRTARETRQDSFEEGQSAQVMRTFLFWHYDIQPGTRSMLFGVFSLLFWGLAAMRLFRRAWSPGWALGLVGGVASLFFGSLVFESTVQASQQAGVVIAPQVIARTGDGQSYEPAYSDPLHAGAEFVLLDARNDWNHVELPDGRQCWIPSGSADLVGR